LGLAAKGGATLLILIYMQIQTHIYREISIFLYRRVFFFFLQRRQDVWELRLGLVAKGGANLFK